MDLGLKGKRAAIQGASSGIGFAIAKVLAKEGAKVAICSRDQGRISKAAEQIPGAHAIALDLDEKGSGKQFIQQAVKALGGIDILVANSGGPPKGDFCELTMEDWEEGYKRLWQSAVESMLEALGPMKKQRFGRIILSTSTAAKEPISHLTVSNGFRAGLLGLMKSVSREVAPFGVTVNAILPGYTQTHRLEELGIPLEALIAEVPAKRLAQPDEMGYLAAFLASTQAAYITGQAIACDGGLIRSI